MTRSAAGWSRPLAAFLALWVALFVGEPGLVHGCPVHGGIVAAAAPGHDGGGSRMAVMGDAHAAPAHQHHQGGHHGCTCPGDCTAGSSVVPALPAAPTTGALVEPTYRVVADGRPVEASLPRLAPPHALPFANGPPAAAPPRAA
jgi:hypothetical protein